MTLNVAKAELWKLDAQGNKLSSFKVQFNPDSLKVTFANQLQPANQNATDNQHGTASTQYVGRGSTKLAVSLYFDVNAELPEGLAENDAQRTDVRELTGRVIDLIRTQPVEVPRDQPIPPAVRFLWGSFQFDGLVESIDQTLEFFSPEGIPQRAVFALSMTQQSISYAFPAQRPQPTPRNAGARLPGGAAPGAAPLTAALNGASLQAMASAQGKFGDWQAIAQANGIENPRLLAPGQLIDMNVEIR